MISARYVPAICVMLALALAPTIMHSYAHVVATDGRKTGSIATSLAGFESRQGGRNTDWIGRDLASDDWIERTYTSGQDSLRLTVVRSYDWKRLYHHPELAIAHGVSLGQHEIVRFPASPEIPVHLLRDERGQNMALYALHCDRGFVEEPMSFQVRAAGALVFSPRKPMTLFFLLPGRSTGNAESEMQRASALLLAAIDSFTTSGSSR
jgi:hypothetical protein